MTKSTPALAAKRASAIGRALAGVGQNHQVLVVTHLPQVAAFADHQINIVKTVTGQVDHHRACTILDTTVASSNWPECCQGHPTATTLEPMLPSFLRARANMSNASTAPRPPRSHPFVAVG